MLINIFKSNQKVVSLFLLFLSILLWIPSFWVDQSSTLSEEIPFYINNKVVAFIISSLLIGIQAVYLNYIVNEFKLLSSQTHLPGLLFIALNIGAMHTLVFTPLLIINSLILIALHQLFLIYTQSNTFALSFNIGFIIAIATLIYPPIFILLTLTWLTLSYTKPTNWRELIIALLGFSVPLIFYAAYYFLTEQKPHHHLLEWSSYRIFKLSELPSSYLKKSFFIILFLISLTSGIKFFKGLSAHVVKVKKHLIIVLLLLLLIPFTFFLNNRDYLASYVLSTIPLTIIIANFFNEIKRKWLAELIFALLLTSIAVGYFS